jgi:translation initiation factor IF-1
MIKKHITDFKNGWFIGNFEPTLFKTKDFEVAVLHHKKGKVIEKHYQKIATEYNVLISGKMLANGVEINPGDVFVYNPLEITDVQVLEETVVICIKTPSIPEDKICIE